jgi:hypothetical protein
MTTRIQCPWVPSVHHRVPRQAVDAERDLQLVPKHLLLLQAKRCHLEGTVQFPFFSLSLCATIYFSVTNHVEKICVSLYRSVGLLLIQPFQDADIEPNYMFFNIISTLTYLSQQSRECRILSVLCSASIDFGVIFYITFSTL